MEVPSVSIEPNGVLSFTLSPSSPPQASLTILNEGDSHMTFKVKTTRPMRYLVRPNQGVISPKESATVVVILQLKDSEELLRMSESERELSNDKFMVQNASVDESFYDSIADLTPKELADALTAKWGSIGKSSISSKKLRCAFVAEVSNVVRGVTLCSKAVLRRRLSRLPLWFKKLQAAPCPRAHWGKTRCPA